MRGDHHALLRLEIERLACSKIDTRLRLVVAGDFRAEDRVPGKFIPAGKVDHQRNVAVRHRRQKKFFSQALERCRYIRPCIEPMPRQREFAQNIFGQIAQAEARNKAFEIVPVQHVQPAKRDAARADFLHPGLVFTSPAIRKGEPVELVSKGSKDPFRLAGHRGAPVDERPEHVKKHRPNGGHGCPVTGHPRTQNGSGRATQNHG